MVGFGGPLSPCFDFLCGGTAGGKSIVAGEGQGERQRLSNTACDTTQLRGGGGDHGQPEQDNPVHAEETGAGDSVERGQCGFAVADGESAKFELYEDLYDTTKENQPKQRDAGLRTGFGGHDEFAGAHNVCGDDQAWADVFENLQRLPGRRGDGGVVAAVDDFGCHSVRWGKDERWG